MEVRTIAELKLELQEKNENPDLEENETTIKSWQTLQEMEKSYFSLVEAGKSISHAHSRSIMAHRGY